MCMCIYTHTHVHKNRINYQTNITCRYIHDALKEITSYHALWCIKMLSIYVCLKTFKYSYLLHWSSYFIFSPVACFWKTALNEYLGRKVLVIFFPQKWPYETSSIFITRQRSAAFQLQCHRGQTESMSANWRPEGFHCQPRCNQSTVFLHCLQKNLWNLLQANMIMMIIPSTESIFRFLLIKRDKNSINVSWYLRVPV